MKDLHVSWEEYRRLIETLAFNVEAAFAPETSSLEFSICR